MLLSVIYMHFMLLSVIYMLLSVIYMHFMLLSVIYMHFMLLSVIYMQIDDFILCCHYSVDLYIYNYYIHCVCLTHMAHFMNSEKSMNNNLDTEYYAGVFSFCLDFLL